MKTLLLASVAAIALSGSAHAEYVAHCSFGAKNIAISISDEANNNGAAISVNDGTIVYGTSLPVGDGNGHLISENNTATKWYVSPERKHGSYVRLNGKPHPLQCGGFELQHPAADGGAFVAPTEADPPTVAAYAPPPIQHVPGFVEPPSPEEAPAMSGASWPARLNAPAEAPAYASPAVGSQSSVAVATANEAGVYGIQTVGVTLGSTYTSMEIDTGCSTMQITKTMADSLVARGEAVEAGSGRSLLADGSTHADRRVIINSVSIGGKVITNVLSAVGDDNAAMLLGIAALQRFGKFSIDAAGHQLVLG